MNLYLPGYIQNAIMLNPIPTREGRNQPLYERHVTKSGRNRVKCKGVQLAKNKISSCLSSKLKK